MLATSQLHVSRLSQGRMRNSSDSSPVVLLRHEAVRCNHAALLLPANLSSKDDSPLLCGQESSDVNTSAGTLTSPSTGARVLLAACSACTSYADNGCQGPAPTQRHHMSRYRTGCLECYIRRPAALLPERATLSPDLPVYTGASSLLDKPNIGRRSFVHLLWFYESLSTTTGTQQQHGRCACAYHSKLAPNAVSNAQSCC
jgi:hypothetical protein